MEANEAGEMPDRAAMDCVELDAWGKDPHALLVRWQAPPAEGAKAC